MSVVTNPTTFNIVDATLVADKVTAFRVLFGQKSGGPYTLTSADEALASLTTNADGSLTGTVASLNEQLAPGAWFAVAQAKNAGGYSANSNEAAILIVPPVPAAPTFSLA